MQSKDSIEKIYQQYAKQVYKYVLSLSQSVDIAEEVTQETFYQAIKSVNRFDGSCKVSTWLCAIAKNQLKVYYRKHPLTEDIEEYKETWATEWQEKGYIDEKMIIRKLHTYPEPLREILYLRLLGGLSFKEIGEIMGKTENWARVTFYRGKKKLREELIKDEE